MFHSGDRDLKILLLLWGLVVICYVFLIPPVKVAQPADADKYFSPAEQTRLRNATLYRDEAFWLQTARGAVTALLLFGFSFSFGQRLQRITGSGKVRSFLLFFAVLFWFLFIVCLPIDYVDGVVLEAKWGFLRMTAGEWFIHRLKGALLGFGSGLIVVFVIGLLMLKMRRWWLPASAFASLFSFFSIMVAPVLLSPLFSDFKPLKDEKFAARLLSIAEEAGVPADSVFVSDASRRYSHTNAYFSGIFSTRRIVLYDTLLKAHPMDEVEVVVAHEAGHARNHHILKGLLLGILVIFAFFATVAAFVGWLVRKGLMGFTEPRVIAFIWLCGVMMMLILAPFENYLSRRFEAQADLESLRLTDNPDAFIRAEKRLALTNLSALHPNRLRYIWFATHPTPLERIGMAEAYKRGELR